MRTSAHAQPKIVNAMTIDVEDYFQVSAFDRIVSRSDWGQYESRVVANTQRLLQILADASVHATFFVLGWIAERAPYLVQAIAASGHEIASHGYGHRLVYEMTAADFREDVRRAKALLEAQTGSAVMGYRAPSYSITRASLWALDVLVEEGLVYDSSIFPIHHDRYGLPSAPRHPHVIQRPCGCLFEVPPSTVRIWRMNFPVAGGGYFRILPYFVTRGGIRRLNVLEGKPAVFYVHPWEVDPQQPRFKASWLSTLRHYRNLDKTEQRLRRLLATFRFDSVASILFASRVPQRVQPAGSARKAS